MPLTILDPHLSAALIRRRRRLGLDRFDEVWDGVYVMSPLANNEHQEITTSLALACGMAVTLPGLGKVLAGANISDRPTHWKRDHRCPDVLVFLNGTTAQDRKAHWLGGPDFAVEVVSRHDRTRQKLDFYARVGTGELLVVDRHPWALELYRRGGAGTLDPVGRSTVEQPDTLAGAVLPLSFRLEAGEGRPRVVVAHADGVQGCSA